MKAKYCITNKQQTGKTGLRAKKSERRKKKPKKYLRELTTKIFFTLRQLVVRRLVSQLAVSQLIHGGW
jgi:hypothetical protein